MQVQFCLPPLFTGYVFYFSYLSARRTYRYSCLNRFWTPCQQVSIESLPTYTYLRCWSGCSVADGTVQLPVDTRCTDLAGIREMIFLDNRIRRATFLYLSPRARVLILIWVTILRTVSFLVGVEGLTLRMRFGGEPEMRPREFLFLQVVKQKLHYANRDHVGV